MRISKERFEELVSLYLDKEASADELDLLSACVRKNQQMRAIWLRACRVHAATMKLYGKNADFMELPKVGRPFTAYKRPSKVRVCLEWSGVAALMLLSFGLFAYAAGLLQNDTDVPPNAEYGWEQNRAFCALYDIRLTANPNIVEGEYCIMEINPRLKPAQ